MTRKILYIIIFSLCYCAFAQGSVRSDFKPVCDSLSTLLGERTGVKGRLILKSVMKRGNALDFYFTESLGDFPWRHEDIKWFKNTLRSLFPNKYSSCRLGEIYGRGDKFEGFATVPYGSGGTPAPSRHRVEDHRKDGIPIVSRVGEQYYEKGLSGIYIALWASHGRYYDQVQHRWQWQRPCLFQTVEDLYTSSYVLPFLVPMLENAGAYVMMPRERDTNPTEIVVDNDPSYSFNDQPYYRGTGKYTESGIWSCAGKGFADSKEIYIDHENPFTMGTARAAACTDGSDATVSSAKWEADFPSKGEYAVYISYKSLPNSTESAHYTVNHLGGSTEFTVNQKMGGGTWIYLGTFEFDKGCSVVLDNVCPKGRKFVKGSAVCADAVKFGGGMGNIARYDSGGDASTAEVSGLPKYAEAARYWLQWAGMDSTVYSWNKTKDDYRDDLFSRGEWVDRLSGGSRVNPKKPGLGIPVDLAFALHSDAGTAQGDTIVGTLAIYSGRNGYSRTFPAGGQMAASREYADIVQSQVVDDIRAEIDSNWTRRQIWDRGYRESRTSPVPAVLLESLSHQNFADMRFGQDPEFRFIFCRAVYKGMLKYLSNRYGCPYSVQPLPVNSFAAILKGNTVELSWKETPDRLEPTASAEGYILYTRIDNGGFDNGKILKDIKIRNGRIYASVRIEPGHIYSYRIAAYNEGGKSFPSETLAAGLPASPDASGQTVLIVNNFTRLAPPAWFDTHEYAGFDNWHDGGVAYFKEISFIGEMYERRKGNEWTSNDNPGFGASYSDRAGTINAGNTFDYPYVHGKSIIKAGYPFCSAGADAFSSGNLSFDGIWAADIICGKQVTTPYGSSCGKQRYTVFPQEFQSVLRQFTSGGGHVLLSGEYVGTDIWDTVYPVMKDPAFRESSIEFAEKVLGFRWKADYASKRGTVRPVSGSGFDCTEISYNCRHCPETYAVETPDGLEPSSASGKTILRYSDTGISAGVDFTSQTGYKTVCIGFPIEAIQERQHRDAIIGHALKFFSK